MSLTLTPETTVHSGLALPKGNPTVPQFFLLTLLITLAAIAGDQLLAPALYSTSPLWATGACLALAWRRGDAGLHGDAEMSRLRISPARVAIFVLAHAALVLAGRMLYVEAGHAAGSFSATGWLVALLKLSVLLPTLILTPVKQWRIFARTYASEGVAAAVVLFTFFPSRVAMAIWPWYGQVLGRFVFDFSSIFTPGLIYAKAFTPTIHGPNLDVTILYACSGISGVDLYDYLFAFVAFLDWNRLRKDRTLLAYFGGVAAMLIGNALRISSFVIFGNHGFADAIAHFHITAGWIFFSVVFLAYLSLIYRKLLSKSV